MSNFSELLEDRAKEYFLKEFSAQGPLLVHLFGDLKVKPLTSAQRRRLDREGKLSDFADRLHALAVALGATCDHEDC